MLTYEAFCDEAQALAARSRQAAQRQSDGSSSVRDGGDAALAVWEWRHGSRSHLTGNAYLVSVGNALEWRVDVNADGDLKPSDLEDEFCGDTNELLAMHEDDAIVAAPDPDRKQTQTLMCDFHIVYHVIYQTPVLYFRATKLDGTPVAISTQIADLHLPGSNAASTFVSMEEHPVLGTPFWFLHPCETSSAMELLQQQQHKRSDEAESAQQPAQYLLAWLSLVQPLTCINPLAYS